jgi:hypothetical protein
MINFMTWFELDNKNHMLAFIHLCEKGYWPIGFIPKNVFMTDGWDVTLKSKMAKLYAVSVISK